LNNQGEHLSVTFGLEAR